MKKWFGLAIAIILCLGFQFVTQSSLFHPPLAQAQTPAPAPATAGNCSLIGNNLAVQFGTPGAGYAEARYTLALLTGEEHVAPIIQAINGTNQTVIVRLGAGKDAPGPPSGAYAAMLNQIAAEVAKNGKSFIATAGHNEPNCAEYIPLADEAKYMEEVAGAVTASNVILITGQIDYYCGDPDLPKPSEYIQRLSTIPNIKGIALPFYITEGGSTADAALALFNDAASLTGLPIYVTESGPFLNGSMSEFVAAVPQVVSNPRVQAFLLFNALGINRDTNFRYTRPFWNPACREAFRTSCNDPTTVLEACGVSTEADEYYLYPIGGLTQHDSNTIFNDLINQGYQPHCSTPKFEVEAVPGGDVGRLMELISQGRASIIHRDLTSSQVYDFTNSQVPVLRDSNPVAAIYNSLEDYWGFQHLPEPAQTEDPQDLIAGSPIYNLLTLEQQCQYKVQLLETIENMCNMLADPSKCALYQPIPGHDNYTTQTLLDDYRTAGLNCRQLISNPSAAQKPLANAIQSSPLYLDRAYRLAFLVITAELKDNGPTSFFNFLRRDGGNAQPRDEVRVIAFKIPDVGTNKPEGPLYYQDPLQLTRDSLISYEQIQENAEKAEEIKDKLRNGGGAGSPPIDCGGPACGDPLVQALIKIVNNNGVACESNPQDLRYEPAETIESSGNLTSGPGTQFNDGSDPAKNLFTAPEDQVDNPQEATFNFLSQIRLGAQGDSQSKIKAYLVYPMGHELETVENSFLAFFNTSWTEQYRVNPDIFTYFKLNDVDQGMNSGKVEHTFRDPDQPCRVDPDTQLVVCGNLTAEAEFKSDQTDREPRILGGRLGYLTRVIQETMFDLPSKAYRYVSSCQTTEDFLLGRCGGGPVGDSDTVLDPGVRYGNGTCDPVPEGPCSVENLKTYFTDSPGGDTALDKAEKASRICNRESGGNSQAFNNSCLRGGSVDYSVGLFQINLLAHCADAFTYTWEPVSCSITNQSMATACLNNMLDPTKNIQKMIQVSSNGTNWGPWSAAKVCGIE